MKSTAQISSKLKDILAELNYINDCIMNKGYKNEDRYVYPNGKKSDIETNTFDYQLTQLVAQKTLLYWVLDKN